MKANGYTFHMLSKAEMLVVPCEGNSHHCTNKALFRVDGFDMDLCRDCVTPLLWPNEREAKVEAADQGA